MPNKRAALLGKTNEIIERSEQIMAMIKLAKHKKKEIVESIELGLSPLKTLIVDNLEKKIHDIKQRNITDWISEMRPQGSPNRLPNIITSELRKNIKLSLNQWQQRTLAPKIKTALSKKSNPLSTENFNHLLDAFIRAKIEVEITGFQGDAPSSRSKEKVKESERIQFFKDWRKRLGMVEKYNSDHEEMTDNFSDQLAEAVASGLPLGLMLGNSFAGKVASFIEEMKEGLESIQSSFLEEVFRSLKRFFN